MAENGWLTAQTELVSYCLEMTISDTDRAPAGVDQERQNSGTEYE